MRRFGSTSDSDDSGLLKWVLVRRLDVAVRSCVERVTGESYVCSTTRTTTFEGVSAVMKIYWGGPRPVTQRSSRISKMTLTFQELPK